MKKTKIETTKVTIEEAMEFGRNPKFRLRIEECNDGTKMYYPEVFVVVDLSFAGFFRPAKYVFAWRGLFSGQDGYDTLTLSDHCDGCGCGLEEDALAMLEQYKIDRKKRSVSYNEKKKEEENKKVKQVTYIEITKTTKP